MSLSRSLRLAVGCAAFVCAAGCAAAPLAKTTSPEHWQAETARIMPRAARLEPDGADFLAVKDASGATVGRLILESGSAGGRKFGYAGFIEVALLLDAQNRVAGVLLGENFETPRFLARVTDAGFLTRWNRLELAAVPGHEVDAVASATYSSEAIRYGVRRLAAGAQGGDYRESPEAVREEIAWLDRRSGRLRRMTRQCESELAELRGRKAEYLELRRVGLLRGDEAAEAYAEARKLNYDPPRRSRMTAELAAAVNAAEALRRNDSPVNRTALEQALEADYARRLAEAESELDHCRITVREAEARLAYLKSR